MWTKTGRGLVHHRKDSYRTVLLRNSPASDTVANMCRTYGAPETRWGVYPGLPAWASLCRAYGALELSDGSALLDCEGLVEDAVGNFELGEFGERDFAAVAEE